MIEDEQQKIDKQEYENLKMGYDALNEEYKVQTERLNLADQKSNMLLVFNAAILALLILAFPIADKTRAQLVVSVIFLCLFFVSIILTLTMIILSIFPRKTEHLSHYSFITADFYHCTNIEFMGKIMGQKSRTIDLIHRLTERKFLYIKIATITTVINIFLIVILVSLKVIFGGA